MSIENFEKTDELFSLGLNCGLCRYRLLGNCNGCFRTAASSNYSMISCSVKGVAAVALHDLFAFELYNNYTLKTHPLTVQTVYG